MKGLGSLSTGRWIGEDVNGSGGGDGMEVARGMGGPDDQSATVTRKHFSPLETFLCLVAMEAKFFRYLKLVGVGYKARTEREGRELFLKFGYSHEVQFTAPPAVRVFCFKPNLICCTGIDKNRVHNFAGAVRNNKPPEVYNGKDILYIDEVIKLKPGKKLKK
uniref:Large ribosomal subunit protein uL6 alpha-beta domain-containing protein n=1 Tax=Oryza punctata TaxID=4537 RepID=A0A0E0LW40_ORYPU